MVDGPTPGCPGCYKKTAWGRHSGFHAIKFDILLFFIMAHNEDSLPGAKDWKTYFKISVYSFASQSFGAGDLA